MKTYSGIIEKLKKDEIFVFGSNLSGFHGAGSAGYASFGVVGNRWREFGYDKKPDGWQGLWNVKGVGVGLQKGREGWSYALPTVAKAGLKRSLSVSGIKINIDNLYATAVYNKDFWFLMAFGGSSLNGYSSNELASMFGSFLIPENIVFEAKFYEKVKKFMKNR